MPEITTTPSDPPVPASGPEFHWGVFGLLAVVLVLVAVSNVWLRRRAEAKPGAKTPGARDGDA